MAHGRRDGEIENGFQVWRGPWFALLERAIVGHRTQDAVAAKALGASTRYGLGVMLRTSELGPTRGHDGVFIGYSATVLWFERHDVAVAVLANTDSAGRGLVPAAVALARIAIESREGGKRR